MSGNILTLFESHYQTNNLQSSKVQYTCWIRSTISWMSNTRMYGRSGADCQVDDQGQTERSRSRL